MSLPQYLYDWEEAYLIASAVLIGILMLFIVLFACLSLVKARSGNVAILRFVPWMKAAFWIFSLTVILEFIHDVLILCVYNYATDADSHQPAALTAYHMEYLEALFRHISAALIMVFLVELGSGMLENVSKMFGRYLWYIALAVAAVIVCLAVTFYGILVDVYVNKKEGYWKDIGGQAAFESTRDILKLRATNLILLFIMSLVIATLSVYVFTNSRASPFRSASTLYLAAGLLNLLTAVWGLVYAIHWHLNYPFQEYKAYVPIVIIVLDRWPTAAVLVISLFIAMKNRSSETEKRATVVV